MGKLLVFIPIAALIWTGIAIWRWWVSDRRGNKFDDNILHG